MNDEQFRNYLAKRKSSVTGKPLSTKVVGNIVSRCKSVERRYGVDLDSLPLETGILKQRTGHRGGFEDIIPTEITGDYLSAVRKYLDYRLAARRDSSASSN
jgi:hypothetical protein